MKAEPRRVVPCSETLDGIGGHRRRRRAFGQDPAVRPPEAELAVGRALHAVALFVDRAVVPTTQQGKVRQGRRASVCPVTNVMALAEADAAPGEATAAISMLECQA